MSSIRISAFTRRCRAFFTCAVHVSSVGCSVGFVVCKVHFKDVRVGYMVYFLCNKKQNMLYLLLVYYVIMRVPSGLVETSLHGRSLVVGDMVETLPKYVDTSSMQVTKRGGKLVFTFNELSFSF